MADNTKNKESKNTKTNSKPKKSFFKDVKAELKKVTWPTTKQVVNNTVGVIVIVIITAIIVFILDFTFNNFNKYVVNGIRTQISEMQNTIDGNSVSQNVVSEEDGETLENEVSESEVENTTTDNAENNEVVENTANAEATE